MGVSPTLVASGTSALHYARRVVVQGGTLLALVSRFGRVGMGKKNDLASWTVHENRLASHVRPPRVIVAEDAHDIRQLIAVALRGLGYEVVEAATGAALLDELGDCLLGGDKSLEPDVIVTDIRMPGFTGLEILAGLRHAEWSTAIILMTAYADGETREEAERLGAHALFEKPFDIDDLVTRVVEVSMRGAVRARTRLD
jgi:CheY-like chemotaxis protein